MRQVKSGHQSLKAAFQFIQQLIKTPGSIGALLPSGRALCRCIAETTLQHHRSSEQPIVELGPGTGVVTHALLQAGAKDQQLLCIENNPEFVCQLKELFPNSTVLEQSAENLLPCLKKLNIDQVSTIASSLPLLSLPLPVRTGIISGIIESLAPGGHLIQFTYGHKSPMQGYHEQLTPITKKFVLWNLPPAFVWTYQKKDTK